MADPKDYTNSAVDISNPPEVKAAIAELQEWKTRLAARDNDIAKLVSEDLAKDREWARWQVEDLTKALRAAIEEHGGYQDIETETYALFQTRKTPEYDAQVFTEKHPMAVQMVIEQAINKDALKGLIKGGILSEQDLIGEGVITYKETQAFILSLPEPKAD